VDTTFNQPKLQGECPGNNQTMCEGNGMMETLRLALASVVVAALWVILVVIFGMFCKVAAFFFMIGWDMIL